MAKKILATKMDILEFISKKRIVWAYELAEKFRFSHRYVPVLLNRLKKAGLVINMTRGCWELTEDSYKKLKYYGKK